MRRAESENSPDLRLAEAMMRRAIALAATSHPHPNPRVGAVFLSPDGSILTERVHVAAGMPHAEASGLEDIGSGAEGSTLVVTLEPCVHQGRTPPCADALIGAGVARVIVGAVDPDERVAGQGIERLRAAGIDVEVGVLAPEVEAADPGYFHHRRTGLPLVTAKIAATVDGQSAAADGTSQWITSVEARLDGHRMRAEADGILVGAGTVRADDPRLDVRIPGYTGPQPRPIVVAGEQPLPVESRLWGRNPLVYTPGEHTPIPAGVESVPAPGADGVDLGAVIKDLGARGIVSLLVEAGPTLTGALLRARLLDRIVVYYGSILGGGVGRPMMAGRFATLTEGIELRLVDSVSVGPDVKVTYELSSSIDGQGR